MADTQRALSELVALLATNSTKDVSAQDLRDVLVSAVLQRTRAIATSGAVTTDDRTLLVDVTSGDVTLSLPAAAAAAGHTFTVKITAGANDCILATNSTEEIDGVDGLTFDTAYSAVTIQSDGTGWHILSMI